jgi:cytochrome oxidase Cu insertion factor (SCO1/SenC/PrrC family)
MAATVAAALAIAGCSAAASSAGKASAAGMGGTTAGMRAADANPDLDPGSALNGIAAPDFTLVDQFGQRMSLSDFRGKVVILAFTDSECTTICPLTSQSMLAAKQLLGAAGSQVQLIGIDANPAATKVSDVMAYSRAHGMVNQWDFLTGSDAQLAKVWKAYGIYVQIEKGQIDHTPAVFIIDASGREQKLYMTTMAYASITQAAQVMAQEASSLLTSHPALASVRSLAHVTGLSPRTSVRLAAVRSGSLALGPGKARLVMFFATWLDQTSDLRARLLGLKEYSQAAAAAGLPALVAVDEEAAEPSLAVVRGYVASIGKPLGYPVALDPTGRVADGYGVQDQPWFVLTSATGMILWKHDGWLSVRQLTADVRAAAR